MISTSGWFDILKLQQEDQVGNSSLSSGTEHSIQKNYSMELAKNKRITSIDLLRGFIMIIMALDHVRDYFHADAFIYDPLDLSKTSVVLYFTRWITHFCAPIFVLLAGTSAFLSGQRKTKKELAAFLVKRGIWLIILEETAINFSWFFNIHFTFFILGVIWVLGLSMICLAALIFLPGRWILGIALLMIFGHNLLDNVHINNNGFSGFLWGAIHERKNFAIGDVHIGEGYQFIPWAGVMALGYNLGKIFGNGFDPAKRKKILLQMGVGSWILFVIIRSINIYGNLQPWETQGSTMRTILSFINITKYPPSLDYLLVTEGFAFIFMALTENISNRLTNIISVYGRVPMFYYIIHIWLIHLFALLLVVLQRHPWTDMTAFTSWVDGMASLKGYGLSLGGVYIIWISLIIILYPLCKKYDRYKSSHKDKWWLSYL